MRAVKEKIRHNERYPLISLRITQEQRDYLRRESTERGVKVAEYVRAILFPFALPPVSDGEK